MEKCLKLLSYPHRNYFRVKSLKIMLQSSVGCAGFSLQEEITLYYAIEVTVQTQSTFLKLIQFGHLCILKKSDFPLFSEFIHSVKELHQISESNIS